MLTKDTIFLEFDWLPVEAVLDNWNLTLLIASGFAIRFHSNAR